MRKIERKRTLEELKIIEEQKVNIINAPPGYGKTMAMKQYMSKQDNFLWIDLKDKDISTLSMIGTYEKCKYLVMDHMGKRHFKNTSIDDILSNPKWQHIILISSDDLRDININDAHWITAEVFCYNNFDDIQKLAALNKISSMNEADIHKILEYTGGWIKGIVTLLKDYMLYNEITVTSHYADIIHNDLYCKLDVSLQESLCYLSEFTEFSTDILKYFQNPGHILNLLKRLSAINWMVSYHEKRNMYSLMKPFKIFLFDKIIEEKLDLNAFYYYFAKHYERTDYVEALRFYERAHDFEKIMDVMETHPGINFRDYDPKLMKKIYDGIPYPLLKEHPYVFLHMIHDHLTTYKDILYGTELLDRFTKLLNEGYYGNQTKKLKGELYLIKGYASYNDMRLMCYYFDKAYSCIAPAVSRIANSKMTITYGSPHIMYLYHSTPGKMMEIIKLFEQYIENYYVITNFSCVGLLQEAQAECFLETGMYQEAELMAMEAYYKAKDFNQNCIAITALMTLGRVGLVCFKKDLYMYAINAMKLERQKTNSSILKREIDCALAYLHALNDELYLIPKWLRTQQSRDLLTETNSYMYVAYGLIYVKQKRFFHLKVLADILSKIHVYRKHVFGDIYALLFKTIAYDNLGAEEQAKNAFLQLIDIVEKDMIVMPLVEFSEYIEPYIRTCKTNMYLKKLKSKIKEKQHGHRTSVFSERELEIIQYINAGYTRKKTADMLQIKESSVSTMMKRIYKKANITNKDDLKDFCNQL